MTALNRQFKTQNMKTKITTVAIAGLLLATALPSCKPKSTSNAVSGDASSKAYVAPGKYDEFYNFVSGGFSGQISVYGLPSGRLLRVVPVFSVDPQSGYGY